MNEKQYAKQIEEILKHTQNKFQALQEGLNTEDILKFTPYFPFFLLQLIESFVGREDLLSFMVALLGMADNIVNPVDEVKKRQTQRVKNIIGEN